MVGGRLRCLFMYIVGLLLGVFLHDVEASGGKRVIDKKVGDSVELSVNLQTAGVSRATWKYKKSMVADQRSGVMANNPFQDRVKFNNVTFSLTVSKLKLQDSGDFSFTAEINGQQTPEVIITLQVHEPISKGPTLISNISDPGSNGFCTVSLECRAVSHSNVTYIWTVGNQSFNGSQLQHGIPPQDGDTTFNCTASNAVSQMSASTSMRCSNNTAPSYFEVICQYLIIGAAGGGLLVLTIIIAVSVCLCRRRWSGSDSNELTVYADISDFSPELGTTDNSKPCSLYDTIENTNSAGPQMPQTVYDKIQFDRMRKLSVSPYQEVS